MAGSAAGQRPGPPHSGPLPHVMEGKPSGSPLLALLSKGKPLSGQGSPQKAGPRVGCQGPEVAAITSPLSGYCTFPPPTEDTDTQ